MNKTELIGRLARRTGMPVDGARQAVEALFGSASDAGLIAAALGAGERVQLPGFGTFETRRRRERLGRNPHTKQSLVIPARVAPAFRPASGFKAGCAAAGGGAAA